MKRFLSQLAASSVNSPQIILSKFRGCLIGGLVGDCCGAPFENEILEKGDKLVLKRFLDKLEGPLFKAPQKSFTDDTALTIAVAKCLINFKELSSKELAKCLAEAYFENPKRGYGSAVPMIFKKLRKQKYEDPLRPSSEVFNGLGSFGNGAAMRVCPVALFCYQKPTEIIEMAKKSALITHSNEFGFNGAILQAIAISLCLHDTPETFNTDKFLDHLIETMKELEIDNNKNDGKSYENQLNEIKTLLLTNPSEEIIVNKLGHSAAALYSVPTAIFCFLKGQHNIAEIQSENPFRRTIEYAISLGGDTDTIASMAGCLVGALHGDSIISNNLVTHCEANTDIMTIANELHQISL